MEYAPWVMAAASGIIVWQAQRIIRSVDKLTVAVAVIIAAHNRNHNDDIAI